MGERVRTMQKGAEAKRLYGVSRVKKPNSSVSRASPVEQILHLQRTIGNRAVTRLIESGMIQAQTRVSMQMANVGGGESFDTRFSFRSTDPDAKQSAAPRHHKTVGSSVAGLISRSCASHTLPGNVRRQFARISGDDLSEVRVHDDSPAHEAARQLGAHAFTIGRSIYFGADQYRPSTLPGKHLLAHEVAHTIQQRSASVPSFQNLTISPSTDVHETEADRFADSVVNLDAKPTGIE